MIIIKRNGTEAVFEAQKITNAVTKANNSVGENIRLTVKQIQEITESVIKACKGMGARSGG